MWRRTLWLVLLLSVGPHVLACGDDEREPVPEWDFGAKVHLDGGQCVRVGRAAVLDVPDVTLTFATYWCPPSQDDQPSKPSVDLGCADPEPTRCTTPASATRPKGYRITRAECAPDCTARVVASAFGERVEVSGTREVEAEITLEVELTGVDETSAPLRATTRSAISFQTDGRCESDSGVDASSAP